MCPPCLPSISFYFYVVADQKKKARKKTRSQIKRKEVCCQLVAQLALQTKNCQNRPTAEAGYEDPVRNVPCTQSMCLRWLLKCSFQHKVIKCEDRRQCSTNQGFQIFFSKVQPQPKGDRREQKEQRTKARRPADQGVQARLGSHIAANTFVWSQA